ncbi:MAG: 2Fe-2S iron-sulfur cluster-binding protein [Cyclobacteriaceae bacterium]
MSQRPSSKIKIEERFVECHRGETVLDALIRKGEPVRFSCKEGVCKTCRMTLVEGEVPRHALRPFLHLEDHSFLPCLSKISGDIEVGYPSDYRFPENHEPISPFEHTEETSKDKPAPNKRLMNRLLEGDLLNEILHAFYTEVYEDELLSPFFKSVTKQRSIEKQYNFLSMLFSGEENYIGALPRNAHHWMVISDELFDYREEMMIKHMRLKGLEQEYIDIWAEFQEYFRSRMVKSKPWLKIIDGYSYPMNGLEETVTTIGMICDKCHAVIDEGDTIKYHSHSGEAFCLACAG